MQCVGQAKHRDRPGIVRSFQSGELDALVIQVKTGGVGIDLFAACEAVVYSPSRSWITFDQAVARLHRRGQTRPVTIHLFIAEDTVDNQAYKAIWSKSSLTKQVLDDLKLRRTQRPNGEM